MTGDEFVGLVGPTLAHVTAAANLPAIRANGLLRPVTLAARAGVDPEGLVLRREARTLTWPGGAATLNHQRPLRAGLKADFLDGVTIREWSAMLDGRLFFWPRDANNKFVDSVSGRGPAKKLLLDARGMFEEFAAFLDLSPLNSGDATRSPRRRGAWLYTPVTASVSDFREARQRRKLVAGRDDVKEVSLRCDLPPEALSRLERAA